MCLTDFFVNTKFLHFQHILKYLLRLLNIFTTYTLRCLQCYGKETPGLICEPIFFLLCRLGVLVFSCDIFFPRSMNIRNMHEQKFF